MIIEYDKSPNVSPEQKIQSLAESVMRAFEEIETTEKKDPEEYIPTKGGAVKGALELKDNVYLHKGKYIYGQGTDGEWYRMVGTSSGANYDNFQFGYDGYDKGFGAAYYNGNVVYVRSKGDINFQAGGRINIDSNVSLANAKYISCVTTSGTYYNTFGLNTSDNLLIGYGPYVNSIGTTYLYGYNDLYLMTNGRIYPNRSVCLNNTYGLLSYLADGSTTATMIYTNASNNCIVGSGSFPNVYVGYTNENLYLRTSDFTLRLCPPDSGSTGDGYFFPVADGTVSLGTTAHRWSRVYASNSSISTSDRRHKENIKPIGNVTKAISTTTYARGRSVEPEVTDLYSELFDKLEPVEYNFIDGDGRKNFGLIAQDILTAMEELGLDESELDLVHHESWVDEKTGEEKDAYGLAYENLIALLIHEVQKLKGVNNER